ncbi:MAG TPA: hypothetical protein PLD25_07975 [Chloroflexota bacterium]|nr:hypothetical protein [Chloroflexota bacterium]
MNEKHTAIDWKFWRRWVLFSTLGYSGGIGGWLIALILGTLLYTISASGMVVGMALGGAAVGAFVGLMQGEAVRLKAPHAIGNTWITVNIVGMAISWAILFGVLKILDEPLGELGIWIVKPSDYMILSLLAAGGLWGLISATIQWYTFQGRIKHAAIWFILNCLCGVVLFVISWFWIWIHYNPYGYRDEFSVLSPIVLSFTSIILWPIAGLLYGMMTGTLLAWLLREPNQPDELNEHVLAG